MQDVPKRGLGHLAGAPAVRLWDVAAQLAHVEFARGH